jgi:hypothetical protein
MAHAQMHSQRMALIALEETRKTFFWRGGGCCPPFWSKLHSTGPQKGGGKFELPKIVCNLSPAPQIIANLTQFAATCRNSPQLAATRRNSLQFAAICSNSLLNCCNCAAPKKLSKQRIANSPQIAAICRNSR